ncbi:hypothetical protein Ciccas_007444 [Cichlidogyrus casuarinus]|uniref:Uncharacterized protein n=1 Tax=Cichlidogyrus casuarinus TaxID=1844966 RepID=A0ABD2Q484_9PLAT
MQGQLGNNNNLMMRGAPVSAAGMGPAARFQPVPINRNGVQPRVPQSINSVANNNNNNNGGPSEDTLRKNFARLQERERTPASGAVRQISNQAASQHHFPQLPSRAMQRNQQQGHSLADVVNGNTKPTDRFNLGSKNSFSAICFARQSMTNEQLLLSNITAKALLQSNPELLQGLLTRVPVAGEDDWFGSNSASLPSASASTLVRKQLELLQKTTLLQQRLLDYRQVPPDDGPALLSVQQQLQEVVKLQSELDQLAAQLTNLSASQQQQQTHKKDDETIKRCARRSSRDSCSSSPASSRSASSASSSRSGTLSASSSSCDSCERRRNGKHSPSASPERQKMSAKRRNRPREEEKEKRLTMIENISPSEEIPQTVLAHDNEIYGGSRSPSPHNSPDEDDEDDDGEVAAIEEPEAAGADLEETENMKTTLNIVRPKRIQELVTSTNGIYTDMDPAAIDQIPTDPLL